MKEIVIREATIEDLTNLLLFQQGVVDWERPFDPTIAKDPVWYYDLEELILDKNVAVIVAAIENQLVGCGLGMEKEARPYLEHATYAYFGLMYTKPDFRGKGVNAKIIASLKTWAFEKGLKEMRLTVYDENESAIKAYEKVGFKKHIVEMRLK